MAVHSAGRTGSTLILIAMIVSTFGFMTATMLPLHGRSSPSR
jgi:hypothetical protein